MDDLDVAAIDRAFDEARVCSRKLRVALVALEVIAGHTKETKDWLPQELQIVAQAALDRIGELK